MDFFTFFLIYKERMLACPLLCQGLNNWSKLFLSEIKSYNEIQRNMFSGTPVIDNI